MDGSIPAQLETLNEIRKVSDELNLCVTQNAVEVKSKLVELLQEDEEKKATSRFEKESLDLKRKKLERLKLMDEKMAAQLKEKILLRMDHVSREVEELRSKISKDKDVNTMTDDEIKYALLESKEWKGMMKSVQEKLEAVMVDSVGIDVDQEDLKQLCEKVKLVSQSVAKKVDELVEKDYELCLYTLMPWKNENCVHYPEPFGGELHENVFAFVEDMKQALLNDRIQKKSKVKVLLNHLKGEAKGCVEFCENIEDAFATLLRVFNTPRKVWEKKKEEIVEAYGRRNTWGSTKSVQRRKAISKMISYLEEAKKLSNVNKIFRNLILSRTTHDFFYNLLPEQLQEEVSKSIISKSSSDSSIDERLDCLLEVLSLNLRVTVDKLDITAGKPKDSKKFDAKSPTADCVKVHVKSKSPVKQHSCSHSPQCKSEWNNIGCIKLYHLKSVDQRTSFLKKMKSCIKCGRKFSKFHKCRKDSKLEDAMCTNLQCKLPSALCNAHINDGNATPVLRRWLSKNGVTPDVIF